MQEPTIEQRPGNHLQHETRTPTHPPRRRSPTPTHRICTRASTPENLRKVNPWLKAKVFFVRIYFQKQQERLKPSLAA